MVFPRDRHLDGSYSKEETAGEEEEAASHLTNNRLIKCYRKLDKRVFLHCLPRRGLL